MSNLCKDLLELANPSLEMFPTLSAFCGKSPLNHLFISCIFSTYMPCTHMYTSLPFLFQFANASSCHLATLLLHLALFTACRIVCSVAITANAQNCLNLTLHAHALSPLAGAQLPPPPPSPLVCSSSCAAAKSSLICRLVLSVACCGSA